MTWTLRRPRNGSNKLIAQLGITTALMMTTLGVASPATATDYEWDGGAGDNLWNGLDTSMGIQTNWNPENFPLAADNIILTGASPAGPITINLNGAQNINRIEVNGVDGTYTFDNTSSGALSIHLAGGNPCSTAAHSAPS